MRSSLSARARPLLQLESAIGGGNDSGTHTLCLLFLLGDVLFLLTALRFLLDALLFLLDGLLLHDLLLSAPVGGGYWVDRGSFSHAYFLLKRLKFMPAMHKCMAFWHKPFGGPFRQ